MKIKQIMFLCISITMLALWSGGCQSQRELKNLIIVMGIGMDNDTEVPGNVKLTAQIALTEKISTSQNGGTSSGGSENPYINLESSASNTFEAVREYTHMETGKLYIAHAQVFVFGKDMAERGIAPYMDFFVRARETRPTAKIIISQTTAREVLDVKPSKAHIPATDIAQLIETQAANSQSIETNLLDYINAMQSSSSSLIAPVIHIEENETGEKTHIGGMAVFKKDKMVGELNEDEARGVLWVLGKVKSSVINIDIFGGIASLEVLSARSSIKPAVSDGKVTMDISVSASLELAEQTCTENLATRENMEVLQKLAGEAICSEVGQAFYKTAALGADVFGFGEKIHKHYNELWSDMEPIWDSLFPEITLNVKTDVSIVSAGALEKPVWAKEEKQ